MVKRKIPARAYRVISKGFLTINAAMGDIGIILVISDHSSAGSSGLFEAASMLSRVLRLSDRLWSVSNHNFSFYLYML